MYQDYLVRILGDGKDHNSSSTDKTIYTEVTTRKSVLQTSSLVSYFSEVSHFYEVDWPHEALMIAFGLSTLGLN